MSQSIPTCLEKSGLPNWMLSEFEKIPAPNAPFLSMPYRPAMVRLKDGREFQNTIFFGARTFHSLFEGGIDHLTRLMPTRPIWDHYPSDLMLSGADVTTVRPSPNQLPPRIANRLHSVVETRTGSVDFTLALKDGRKFYCTLGNLCDFINYPPGVGPEDLDRVAIGIVKGVHVPTSPEVLTGPPTSEVRWVLFVESEEEIAALLKEQPQIFDRPMSLSFKPPILTEEDHPFDDFEQMKGPIVLSEPVRIKSPMIPWPKVPFPPLDRHSGVQDIKKGEKFYIGAPKVIPQKLIDNLVDLFQSEPGVESAFYAQVYFPERPGDKPHLLVSVKMVPGKEGDYRELLPKMGKFVRGSLGENEYCDFIQATATNENKLPRQSIRFYPDDSGEKRGLKRLLR